MHPVQNSIEIANEEGLSQMETCSASPNQTLNTAGTEALPPDMAAKATQHICVCICTYKRPQLLRRLLGELVDQETSGFFNYSIVVADNDQLRSAEAVVKDFSAMAPNIPVKYCVQPQQNISLTRNKAIENATGDFIAFIDDDEFPIKRWLLTLFETCNRFNVDGVLGPVKRYFDEKPPEWLLKSHIYERPVYPTGSVLDKKDGRTGNVLLKKRLFASGEDPFRPEFTGGSDKDFFIRMMQKGYRFIWCADAVAYEVVPPFRWKRTFMLRKALFRGAMAPLHSTFGPRTIAKSLVAVPAYILALPFAWMLGQDRFMDLAVKLFHHLGMLLALVGIRPISGQYVME
jgi:succinoglycan biosynthesis protein ExoM